ncbi:MAG: polysaccharide biosynthesis C-terminal domain-containing protein, partial [Flavitalea sp.]
TILMMVLSERIVLILLGKEWLFSASILKILSLSGLFIILETVNRSLFKIEARTFQLFKLELIKKAFIVLTILATYRFGILPFVYGMVLSAVFSFLLNQYFITIKVSEYKKVFQMLLNGILMAVSVFFVNRYIDNAYVSVIISSIIGLLIYFSFSFIMGVREQKWFFLILTSKFK